MGLIFFCLSTFMIISGLLVVLSKNPIYSVLSLVLTFVNSAGIFILLGAEFIGMSVIIVYVGAVVVLFLFVVMMLDLKQFSRVTLNNIPFSIFISLLLLGNIIVIFYAAFQDKRLTTFSSSHSNVRSIGNILYTEHSLAFQMAGIILLLAMIGCISLVYRSSRFTKIQDVKKQLNTDPKLTVKLKSVEFNKGVDINHD